MRIHQIAGRVPNLQIFYIQGVQDSINLTASNNYYDKLFAFVPQLRRELGYSASNCKIFIARGHEDLPVGVAPYLSTIRAAQELAASTITNAQLFSLDSYTLDGTFHLDGASNIAIGELFGDTLL